MKVKKKTLYIILAILSLIVELGVVAVTVVKVFDIELSHPDKVYYEPDETNK